MSARRSVGRVGRLFSLSNPAPELGAFGPSASDPLAPRLCDCLRRSDGYPVIRRKIVRVCLAAPLMNEPCVRYFVRYFVRAMRGTRATECFPAARGCFGRLHVPELFRRHLISGHLLSYQRGKVIGELVVFAIASYLAL